MGSSPFEIVKLWNHPERYRRRLINRSEGDVSEALSKVSEIVSDVKSRGDLALLKYTEKFDGIELTRGQIRVPEERFEKAYEGISEGGLEAIEEAAKGIEEYHNRQLPDSWMEEFKPGVEAGQTIRPLKSVGCYAPGGNAKYPSSILMTAIPAKVSEVENVIVFTPPDSEGEINPAMLVAADLAGVDEVYKGGGAQAIAAMAYGTKTVPKVDKIVGPGNIYVAAAKEKVSTEVGIDFMAGPSEVLVLADSSADPRLIALDLVAQAEHDPASASVLVTASLKLAEKVREEVGEVLDDTVRRRTAEKSLSRYGRAVVTKSFKKAIEFTNDYAPEHLEIMTKDPESTLEEVNNAGAIFLGENSPVSAGDFAVGPSHVLPTGGAAHRHSGLSVSDFIRQISVQRLSKEGLDSLSNTLERLTEMEGLPAHAQSITERLGDRK